MQMNKDIPTKQTKLANLLANVALNFGKMSVNSCCACIYHQPQMPDALKKLQKF